MNNGHKIIESVTFTPSNAADTTGKMELKFHKDEKVDSKYKYTLSYNVRVTDKAYESMKQMDTTQLETQIQTMQLTIQVW